MREINEFLAKAIAPGADCLTPAQLEAVFEGLAPAPASQHAATCPHCRTELALMKQFIEDEPTRDEVAAVWQIENRLRKSPEWRPAAGDARPERRWFSGWFSGPLRGLAVAGLAAVLAAAYWFTGASRVGQETVDSEVTRGLGIQGIVPLGDLERFPTKLEWRSVPRAASYEVILLDIEEKTLWKAARQPATELRIPVTVLGQMANRKTLFWHIGAYDAQGRLVASSGPQRFRVVPPAQ